jgi:hypothetical protein
MQRWDVKTLSDPARNDARLAPADIERNSVTNLRQMQKRSGDGPERIAPEENTVYEVTAQLIEARWIWDRREGTPTKEKGDRDIHLVISEPGFPRRKMIVEFPDIACVANASTAVKKMIRDARNAFLDCFGLMPSSDRPFHKFVGKPKATINGVGFVDRPHATGHAPHGMEIHPVLHFASTDCA